MPFVIQWVEYASGFEQLSRAPTPVGDLLITAKDEVICATDWVFKEAPRAKCAEDLPESEYAQMLEQYCLNPEHLFPVKLLKQGSDYRRRVWRALSQIPFGATLSYSVLAKQLASAPRAVGNACRDNPFPFLIPCHRVVAMSGLGGYCGQIQGDLTAIKARLLTFEADRKTSSR